MVTRNDIRPSMPMHPGCILRDELKERKIKQKDFAKMIGMQPTHLNALLHGARSISPQLALRLESALQIPARVWLNLQSNYNLDTMRPAEVVDGYTPGNHLREACALSDSCTEDEYGQDYMQKLYRAGEAVGRRKLLDDILSHLESKGYTRQEALALIGLEE